jgi:hypothetical protein
MTKHQESRQERDNKPTGVNERRDRASDDKPIAGGLRSGTSDPENKR